VVLPDETKADSFSGFVGDKERQLRHALTAAYGYERGREAAAEALAYGWEHWERVSAMDNPGGYLYRVGLDRARRMKPKTVTSSLPEVASGRDLWFEPGLPLAMANLPVQQRTVIALLHGYQWSIGEVADLMGISRSTVQSYAERGLAKLRRKLGVEL
jgi:DNA-directed RNA polymerase specialized sigma24 family protein